MAKKRLFFLLLLAFIGFLALLPLLFHVPQN